MFTNLKHNDDLKININILNAMDVNIMQYQKKMTVNSDWSILEYNMDNANLPNVSAADIIKDKIKDLGDTISHLEDSIKKYQTQLEHLSILHGSYSKSLDSLKASLELIQSQTQAIEGENNG